MITSLQFLYAYAYALLSRYSGWGTGDLGAHRAGFFTLFAADNNKHARQSFRLNHPHHPIFNVDLKFLSPLKMLEYAGLKLGDIFIYLVTAPCQGVSSAGLQNPFDPRNVLMHMEPYFISKTSPAAFVFENVAALLNSNMSVVMDKLMEECAKWLVDYDIYYMVLDAASFGVPQSRKRFIMYGLRKDLNIEPFTPEIFQEKPTVLKDIFPDIDEQKYAYNYAKSRDASQVGVTMTSTPHNFVFVRGGKIEKLNKLEMNRYCGNPDDYESVGSDNQHQNRAGNGFMAPMSEAIFRALYKNMRKAGIPMMSTEELMTLTEVSVPLSLSTEKQQKSKRA